MSFALRLSSLSQQQRLHIHKIFTVRPVKDSYTPNPPKYDCFLASQKDDVLYLPLGTWRLYVKYDVFSGELFFPNGLSDTYPKMNDDATLTLSLLTIDTDPSGRKRDQNVVAKLALDRLDSDGAVFVAVNTGFGKMALGIHFSIVLKLKTLIMCHISKVNQQWLLEYNKFSKNVKVQYIEGKYVDYDADVFIIGIQKLSNMIEEDNENFNNLLSNIGTVIVDEAHVATVTAFTQCLLRIQPRYLIGLSATPDRKDGLQSMFNLYFGGQQAFILRHEVKDFTVYKYQTSFEPNIEYITIMGETRLNWTEAIRSVEENPLVWKLVADIAIKHSEEKIIILCDRNALSDGVYDILAEAGESVELYTGSKKKYDINARILVTGIRKGGVGLNDPDLTMAIIASDVTDVRQFEGRVRTTDNIIYHLVHNYKTFENHWNKSCEPWYLKRGAEIKVVGEEHNFSKGKKYVDLPKVV